MTQFKKYAKFDNWVITYDQISGKFFIEKDEYGHDVLVGGYDTAAEAIQMANDIAAGRKANT